MSRSAKYTRWQRLSRKYSMKWNKVKRFPDLFPTHNSTYLRKDRRQWLWAYRIKKTSERIQMEIKHVSWSHAPGTPKRFYHRMRKHSRIIGWQYIVSLNWQIFSKDVTLTGYWMRGYLKRAELIPYPYDHHPEITFPEVMQCLSDMYQAGELDHLMKK